MITITDDVVMLVMLWMSSIVSMFYMMATIGNVDRIVDIYSTVSSELPTEGHILLFCVWIRLH